MAEHVMQFGDGGADWCIHCGTFGCYCHPRYGPCPGDGGKYEARFDSSDPEKWGAMFEGIFGASIEELAAEKRGKNHGTV